MTSVQIECTFFKFYVEINTWEPKKNVNNSIWEWNSLLIPKHLGDLLLLLMAEHTKMKWMLQLPVWWQMTHYFQKCSER